jgi:hypothetical protein
MNLDQRTRLKLAGQLDLSAWVEAATGDNLWTVQRRIGEAASQRRSRVAVPSCVASGKTYLAARLALAFYDAYTPGTPCAECGGTCGGSRVITVSSKHEHLRDILWAELRTAHEYLRRKGILIPGRMGVGQTLRLDDGPKHLMVGTSPKNPEGLQGVHLPHLLVIGDEATALPEEVTEGLISSLATGDARMLLIFNPTTDDTWAAEQCKAARTEVIKITAFDTPHFTGEPVPEGSLLIDQDTLEDLQAQGMGPGTYEWATKVEAKFWGQGLDQVIPEEWYDRNTTTAPVFGIRQLGIDLAPYGSNENVIAYRDGNSLVEVAAFPAMRQDLFFQGPVTQAILKFLPHVVVYDADGVGAGVIGYAEQACSAALEKGHSIQLLPFRGALSVTTKFHNARSAWWWHLRRQFENNGISIQINDPKSREQVTKLKYEITSTGDIKVETKEMLRKRDRGDLDRGDAIMYSWALSDVIPIPGGAREPTLPEQLGFIDRSPEAMMRRDRDRVARRLDAQPDPAWL